MFGINKKQSRLRKKLLLYFILIAVVSVSVSAEIIFEMSSSVFRNAIVDNFYEQVEVSLGAEKTEELKADIDRREMFAPIFDLRNRMVLLLLVVTFSIIGAFILFTRDIVTPMDSMVNATKRIAEGDLTAKVPVMSSDEIGQLAGLINEMNGKLLDMIVQIKQDILRHRDKISAASSMVSDFNGDFTVDEIINNKRMKLSELKNMIEVIHGVSRLLDIMSEDLESLETFINMYKTFSINSEVSQVEIEEAVKLFASGTKINFSGGKR